MAKRKTEVRLRTHGIYSKWESGSKDLPRLQEVTTDVPAVVDVEFGFVVNIKNAKNQELYFCIDHPGIRDDLGKRRAPFDGTVYVKTNDWDFYLGDTVWEPIADKIGEWRMWLELDGKVIAEKTFSLSSAT
ncbi:DUF3859 domain-containing protein [Rhodopirellula sallentina]|uniref:DUF3859 domain-containing protein n=1 Tax=Rhodopirellula sallentina TaxID=1263869 RepID=UPI0005C7E129|nr:DUF3859 domain-containing protein [Rhodopirellula sallentina]